MIKKIILGIIIIGLIYSAYTIYIWNNPKIGPYSSCDRNDQVCLDEWYHNNK